MGRWWELTVALFLVVSSTMAFDKIVHTYTSKTSLAKYEWSTLISGASMNKGKKKATAKSALYFRGGSDSDMEEEYDEEVLKELCSDESALISLTKKSLHLIGKITLHTLLAMQRAAKAGMQIAFYSEDNDVETDDEETMSPSLISKTWTVLTAMWKAALNASDDDLEDMAPTSKEMKKHETNKDKMQNTKVADMGDYLASTYKVPSSSSSSAQILGGSLSDAMRTCRSQARLLVAYIPTSKPSSSKSKTAFDVTCIQSLRSDEVALAVQAKKGSYIIWAAKYGSPEAVQAAKRLRTSHASSSKKNLPTLVVAYPSQVLDKKSGKLKIHPKLLAQHHCNPPPNKATLASFLTALRKRHSSHIKTMRAQLREAELHAERRSNYEQSMQLDTQRKKQEVIAKAEKKAKLEEEKKRMQLLKERRSQFLESLGEEPDSNDEGVVTVALRLADGRNAQRRFVDDGSMDTIFNWVDASFEWDRELLQLTTMRGDKKLEWDDCASSSIREYAGSKTKMLGLRISLRKEQVEEDEAEEAGTES